MSLTGPRKITRQRKLLKATLIGISGQFQRVRHRGSGAADVLMTAVGSAHRQLKASGQALLSLFAAGGSDAPTKSGSSSALLSLAVAGTAITRRQAAGAAALLTAALGSAFSRRCASGSATLTTISTGGGSPPVAVPLDEPVSAFMASGGKGLHAFFFDRVVSGFMGNTVRLVRTSDSAQADFGFDATTGIFKVADVVAWAAGSTVNLVRLYCQMGTGAQLNVGAGTAPYMVAGVVQRFGTAGADSALTRSASDGATGVTLGGAANLLSTALTIDATVDGAELFFLYSHNKRKCRTSLAGDAFGSDATQEFLFAYQTASTTNFMRAAVGGTNTLLASLNGGGTTNARMNNNPDVVLKNAQNVWGYRFTPATFGSTIYGNQVLLDHNALNAATTTAIQGGALNNGKIVVGANFNNFSTPTFVNYADILFGGLIITKGLTKAERFELMSKLNLVGQQHRRKTKVEIEAQFDDYILTKDINAGTGVVSGRKGKVSLTYTTSTVAAGTPDFVFNDASFIGAAGVKFPTANRANGFIANNNYMAGKSKMSVLAVYSTESTGVTLVNALSLGSSDQYQSGYSYVSMSIGQDHSKPNFRSKIEEARQGGSPFGEARLTSADGATGYAGLNQVKGKYSPKLGHNSFTYTGETVRGYPTSEAMWKNLNPSQTFYWDAPTGADVPDNVSFPFKDDTLLIQIVRADPDPNYDPSAAWAARKPYRLTSTAKSAIGTLGSPPGHMTGSIATNPHISPIDSGPTAKLMGNNATGSFRGSVFMYGFLPDALWSDTDIEEINANLYKLLLAA